MTKWLGNSLGFSLTCFFAVFVLDPILYLIAMTILRMERFEIVRGLIDWNLATKIQFVLVPCENARPAAVQYNVMLLIHLCELGVNRIFVTSREDTDKLTAQVRFLA